MSNALRKIRREVARHSRGPLAGDETDQEAAEILAQEPPPEEPRMVGTTQAEVDALEEAEIDAQIAQMMEE